MRVVRRLRPRTLRGRLTLGLVVLLTVIFAGVGLATAALLRTFLVDRLDQQLALAGPRYAESLEHGLARSADGDTRAQAPGTFGARSAGGVVTQAGVIERTAGSTTVALSAADSRALLGLPLDDSAHTVRLSALGTYRLRAVPGADGDTLVTGLPLEHVEDTVRDLAMTELALFGGAVVLAALGGAAWMRLALRPLDRVATTAERVSTLSLASGEVALDVRVPDADRQDEVGRVGASLNRMLGHVGDALARRQAVERRLREFAADAGHELRTPLASVRGHAELALRRGGDPGHALTRIDAEARRMSTIVDDLLLLARLDSGRPLQAADVDLTLLVLNAVDDAQAADHGGAHSAGNTEGGGDTRSGSATHSGSDPQTDVDTQGNGRGTPSSTLHEWRLDLPQDPVVVPGDQHRLAQAVANLVTNARVHTPAGTRITVGIAPRRDAVRLTIEDTGPGLSPELAARAFDRFSRGDPNRSRASGSTGLGLAITRAIAEAHGGQVAVASEPGRTVFVLVLPLVPPLTPHSAAGTAPPASADGLSEI
ncbi:MAG: HAMP domain-containing protein [Catenulispora sp.]|nr:HAMP domain-containing protein [Catenulispora sp.]